MKSKKIGLVYNHKVSNEWWHSHTMAPSAILINEKIIRVFLGCWDINGISRIGYVDVDSKNPLNVLNVSKKPVLDIGVDGTFDENGVFPGHVTKIGEKIFLYYTGFQIGHKIRHYNFGGLAISDNNGDDFYRYSQAPIIDRSNEGLFVRAGLSTIKVKDKYISVYSAGSSWHSVGGKLRPGYDIFLQESKDGISFKKYGRKIIESNPELEHGLGRPQIYKKNNNYYIFYTRRKISMKYDLGYAVSNDLINWERKDDIEIKHSNNGWDSKMVYFPSVLETKNKLFLFYCGNNFGETGFGVAELL